MKAEEFAYINPYQFGNDNPVMFNDPMGDQNCYLPTGADGRVTNGRSQRGPDGNYHVPWLNELLWNNEGFFDRWNQGDASGNYNAISGRSSASVLSNLKFGESYGGGSGGSNPVAKTRFNFIKNLLRSNKDMSAIFKPDANHPYGYINSNGKGTEVFTNVDHGSTYIDRGTRTDVYYSLYGASGNGGSGGEGGDGGSSGIGNWGMTIMQTGIPSAGESSSDPLLKFVGFRDGWIPEFESRLMNGLGAVTPGSLVIYQTGGSKDPAFNTHEPGHVIQYILMGPISYYIGVAIPSMMSAANLPVSEHVEMPWEKSASTLWYWITGESDPSNPHY
jgi:hypothetical protein